MGKVWWDEMGELVRGGVILEGVEKDATAGVVVSEIPGGLRYL